jgi:3-isopropylmalate/(R)-2-methylmalate dehydratase small subunit
MGEQSAGRAWVFGDDINTDLILPGAAFLLPVEEQVKYCFSANRPGWVEGVAPGDVIVAGENFGVGSGRPIGDVFRRLGVVGVIAESFNGLGLRNCVNYGVHVLPCPGVSGLVADGAAIEVDWKSGVVTDPETGTVRQGNPLPDALRDIVAKGGVIALLEAEGLLETGD